MEHSLTPFRTALPLLLSITLAGCSPEVQSSTRFETWDSLGVQITESTRPLWEAGEGWIVETVPHLNIGNSDGDDPYLLGWVRGVTRSPGGAVVVANGMDCTLRVFDREGEFLRAAGGIGEGPEEFERILGIFRVGEEVFVRQYPFSSVKVFSTAGEFLRIQFQKSAPDYPLASAIGAFSDGSLLMMEGQFPGDEKGPVREMGAALRITPEEAVDTLAIWPYADWVSYPSGFSGLQLPAFFSSIAVLGSEVFFSWPNRYEIIVLDTVGRIQRKIRRSWTSVPVDDPYKSRERERVLSGGGGVGGPPEFLRGIADGMVFKDHHPAHHGILLDQTGHLWVRKTEPDRVALAPGSFLPFDPPTAWDIFRPDGVWLGEVLTPARLRVHEIGEDYVLGVWMDDMDVEYVRLYDLRKD